MNKKLEFNYSMLLVKDYQFRVPKRTEDENFTINASGDISFTANHKKSPVYPGFFNSSKKILF